MKKDIQEKVFWKSLDEKYQTDEFKKLVEKEFLSSPFASEDGSDGVARRDFLKLMGASIALASTSCVRKPVDYIVPYAEHPPEITPGVANYYASSWVHQGEGYGFIVKTREGRPIKLEGNPNYPLNKNGLSAWAQAQTLSLYDPDRIRKPLKRTESGSFVDATWDEMDGIVSSQIKSGQVVLLSSSLGSPSTKTLIGDFFTGVKGRHIVWDALGADDVIEGQKASYGKSVLPRYRFDKAKMIVSIDADFLGTWISPTEFTKLFALSRQPGPDMSRLVSFESMLSLTGANADTRIQITPSQQLTAVMGLIYELVVKQKYSRYANDNSILRVLSQYENAADEMGIEPELLVQVAKDLWTNRGKSIVVAGGITTRTAQSHELQVATNFLNYILGNEGKTIDGTSVPYASYEGSYAAIYDLIGDMKAGKVNTLIIHKCNPGYVLPKSAGFAEALKNVKMVIYTGDRLDETGKISHFVAPDHHHLENWGDSEVQNGVYAIQQPTIRPLYDTRSLELSLISWAYGADLGPSRLVDVDTWYDYLKNNWKNDLKNKVGVNGDFETFWTNFLKEGVVDTSSRNGKRNSDSVERKFLTGAFVEIKKIKMDDGMELVLYPKVGHMDGSFSNIAWLQEFPDAITKVVWDNYVNLAPQTAKTLKIKDGQILEIEAGGVKIKAPAHIQPGLQPKTISISVGLGRTDAGVVGSGVGVNAYDFVDLNKGRPIFSGMGAKVRPTSEAYKLASTQDHHSMEGRQIVVQATLAEYLKKPDANIHRHKLVTMWPKHEYKGYRWAMVIDQSACTGCGACIIACQNENNVPTVGKKYVLTGREMHWIRIDRYYTGSEENPQTVFQPMLCQHCENAPCETVCPVVATTHSDEGLNQMTYNRCVGTRYCANNCPYKVRRFNWFNYIEPMKSPQQLGLNPDVTTRSRGVMEKCTFCVQRIHAGKNIAKDQGRKVRDGEIKTACQQSCPADAIVFGNLNDPESKVAKEYANQRSYAVLEEYNAIPMVKYQTKIRNVEESSSEDKGSHA